MLFRIEKKCFAKAGSHGRKELSRESVGILRISFLQFASKGSAHVAGAGAGAGAGADFSPQTKHVAAAPAPAPAPCV